MPTASPPRRGAGLARLAERYAGMLRSSWPWIAGVAIAFVACVVAGLAGSRLNPAAHTQLVAQLATSERLRGALEALRAGNEARAILLIFWNNLSVSLLLLGTGALVWPLFVTVAAIVSNAYLLGALIGLNGANPGRLVRSIAPHAVLELPAVILAAAWSLKMGVAWLLPGASGRRGAVWRACVVEALYLIPPLAVLLALAAVIEVLVSARLSGALGP